MFLALDILTLCLSMAACPAAANAGRSGDPWGDGNTATPPGIVAVKPGAAGGGNGGASSTGDPPPPPRLGCLWDRTASAAGGFLFANSPRGCPGARRWP